jgi:hypothetical protein
MPPADRLVRDQQATGSKVLKVLKVLNFSGAGKINIFTCTFTFAFTGGVAEAPDLASVGCSLLGDGDFLCLARRIHIEIVVGARHSGEAPWRGYHQVVDSVVARRSRSRLAHERLGPGKALPRPRENWFP